MAADVFDLSGAIANAEAGLNTLAGQIRERITNSPTNSGKSVNVYGKPATTTGETAASIKVVVERSDEGVDISLVGRKGILQIDTGSSPEQIHDEYSSLQAFTPVIEKWVDDKVARWGVQPINAYALAQSLWTEGTGLYRAGGGTETITEPAAEAAEKILKQLTEDVSSVIYNVIQED